MTFKNLLSVLALSFFLFPVNTLAQPKTNFVPGKIRLANSDLHTGFIWMSNNLDGRQTIYYREDPKSPVIEYTPDDVLSVTLASRQAKYVSEAVQIDGYLKRVILEVHFMGELKLLSYYNPQENIFFLADNNNQFIELRNTYEKPDLSNDYQFRYRQEYKETLIEKLGGNQSVIELIHNTGFNPKDISKVLIKYHEQREIAYETYPPRRLSGYFVGFGTSASILSHTSDIHDDFESGSPFLGTEIQAGLLFFDNKFEVSAVLRYSYGIISHDNQYSSSDFLTLYYEDVIKTSILGEGIKLTIVPLDFGKIKLRISGGGYYNQFLTYKRELTEEIFHEVDRVVINNFFDDFDKPGPYLSFSMGGGLEYNLNKDFSISLDYSMSIVGESDSGVTGIKGVSVMVNKKF